jgi:hypothetical protein
MPAIRMILFLAALLVPAAASAVTVRDIIEFTKAGLSDDILIALIDADRTVFSLDKNEILALKKAGVSEAVLLKMIRSRREFDLPAATQEPEMAPAIAAPQPAVPEVVVAGAQAPPPVTVVVPQYFYVPYAIWGVPTRHPIRTPQPVVAPEYRGFGRFINDGWVNRP